MPDIQPVFLLGAARSGTKFLRNVLASSADVAAIPFDINYVWRHSNETLAHDELVPEMIDDRVRRHIRSQVFRLGAKAGGNQPILLEKTVSNVLRPDFVRDVFPEALIIYLERDGHDVTESATRQWLAPNDTSYLRDKLRYFPVREWRYALWFARNALDRSQKTPIWGPRYEGISTDASIQSVPEVCARQWKASVDGWQSRTPRPASELEVNYSTLFNEPDEQLAKLCSFTGIRDLDRVLDWFNREANPTSGTWPGFLTSDECSAVDRVLR